MSALNGILNSLPLDQLAGKLGTDRGTAEQSARQGIESLLNGLQSSAADPEGEASLARALQQHSGSKFTGGSADSSTARSTTERDSPFNV